MKRVNATFKIDERAAKKLDQVYKDLNKITSVKITKNFLIEYLISNLEADEIVKKIEPLKSFKKAVDKF